MPIQRRVDVTNLVRELSENRARALETLREALTNAWDHGATQFWMRTSRGSRNELNVVFADDGAGMTPDRLAAFWGVGASDKSDSDRPIGYKGHGSKLFFSCKRLTVATRSSPDVPFRLTRLSNPAEHAQDEVPDLDLDDAPELKRLIAELPLQGSSGTLISIEDLQGADKDELLNRAQIESYCDWFTVIGDVRSGLFESRAAFHQAIADGQTEALRGHERPLRPLLVSLQINGERLFSPIGLQDRSNFFGRWADDLNAWRTTRPELCAFGHRFADTHHSQGQVKRVRDDLSAILLTTPGDYGADGLTLVVRVEGHRRQRETYLEASWQGKAGIYPFEGRFGLWLCKDFIPVVRRQDILQDALREASPRNLNLEFTNLRNWQVFVNSQAFLPTANRNDISNVESLRPTILQDLVRVLREGFKKPEFVSWVQRLQSARLEGDRDNERALMERRRDEIVAWLNDSKRRDAIEPTRVEGLEPVDDDESLQLRAPRNEQELFYLYGVLSARYQLPVRVLEYSTSRGVDSIALLREPRLIAAASRSHVRVEFKYEISANNPIDHFFSSIDLLICWKVDLVGDVYEKGSYGVPGRLQKRKAPILAAGLDSHEILLRREGPEDDAERSIPVLTLSSLFKTGGRRRT